MGTPRAALLALAGLAALAGCQELPGQPEPATVGPAPAPAAALAPAPAPEPAPSAHHPHPGVAPIDCPLRKAGLDPSHLKPFEDVAKYIAFLDRPDRATWQKPDEVVAALGLKGDETVVDVGAGSGYFSFRLARAVPRGKVVALDIEPEMVRHVHHQARTMGITNLTAALTTADRAQVPQDADVVFVCDVLHHVENRPAWLGALAGSLRRGARLVVIEFKEGKLPKGPPPEAKIPLHELRGAVFEAGFTPLRQHDELLPYQVFLEFVRP